MASKAPTTIMRRIEWATLIPPALQVAFFVMMTALVAMHGEG